MMKGHSIRVPHRKEHTECKAMLDLALHHEQHRRARPDALSRRGASACRPPPCIKPHTNKSQTRFSCYFRVSSTLCPYNHILSRSHQSSFSYHINPIRHFSRTMENIPPSSKLPAEIRTSVWELALHREVEDRVVVLQDKRVLLFKSLRSPFFGSQCRMARIRPAALLHRETEGLRH
ncbi:hypothetical protein GGR57DRAFT_390718 [Xylariaceae sp. FL1272]|nr:hypothetical protein GGR57DRAFT_390718 [Xylariaceae sp. FL1272]